MRHTKYPSRRRTDDRVDFNKSWSVYWSRVSPTPILSLIQGSSKNTMDIELIDTDFEIRINDHLTMAANIRGDIKSIADVCTVINNISDALLNEGIIRGRLGGEMFDNPELISDIDFLAFAHEVIANCANM